MAKNGKKTLVLGASDNPQRYSYLAINRLRANQHPVEGIGIKKTVVADINVESERKEFPGIDTVTMYLNPINQKQYYDYILSLHPKRIIFNPGSENEELKVLATKNGIETVEACTLVMLSTGQY